MNDLLRAMQLIDKFSNKIPEGDYLELCNCLKTAYNKRVDPVYFFDYDTFMIPEIGPSEDTYRYFYDHYFDRALNIDSDFIQGQITYLKKELQDGQPIKRITKNVRNEVRKHYCCIHGLDTEEVDVGFSDADWNQMCETYVEIENHFRAKYVEAVKRKLEWLEDSDHRLDTL